MQIIISLGCTNLINRANPSDKRKGKKVENTFESEGFGKVVKKTLSILQPIIKVIRIVDGGKKKGIDYLMQLSG